MRTPHEAPPGTCVRWRRAPPCRAVGMGEWVAGWGWLCVCERGDVRYMQMVMYDTPSVKGLLPRVLI